MEGYKLPTEGQVHCQSLIAVHFDLSICKHALQIHQELIEFYPAL